MTFSLQENKQTIILYVKEISFHNFGIQRRINNKDNVKDIDKYKWNWLIEKYYFRVEIAGKAHMYVTNCINGGSKMKK